MSEILKRLQQSMKSSEKPSSKAEKPKLPKQKPQQTQRRRRKPSDSPEVAPHKKKNVQHNKSLILNLLDTVNVTSLTPKQKRALESLGTSEPQDKTDRKLVTLWDQKKTAVASIELILSILMQHPVEVKLTE